MTRRPLKEEPPRLSAALDQDHATGGVVALPGYRTHRVNVACQDCDGAGRKRLGLSWRRCVGCDATGRVGPAALLSACLACRLVYEHVLAGAPCPECGATPDGDLTPVRGPERVP